MAPRSKADMRVMLGRLLWLYLFLLLFEGGLRKWFLPQFSDLLLVARVPLTALIYAIALAGGIFPRNGWTLAAIGLAFVSFMTAIFFGHGNIFVATYGVLTSLFSIPLIFIIPRVWNAEDLKRVVFFLMVLTVPMTVLLGLQFYQPQSAWVNRGVGGVEGAGFSGALGRYRPPGTFSFTTGTVQFYQLVIALFLAQLVHRRTIPMWLLYAVGICIPLAFFASISRTLAVMAVFILVVTLAGMFLTGRKLGRLIYLILGLLVFNVIAMQFDFYTDSAEAFTARWERATGEEKGGIQEAIFGRMWREVSRPFTEAGRVPFFGNGIGQGTQVGARLLTGSRGFFFGEGEFWRIVAELGPPLGFTYILFRMGLAIHLGMTALAATRRGNLAPWVVFGATFFLLTIGQWGQQTTLGFAVFSAGLAYALARHWTPRRKNRDSRNSGDPTTQASLQRASV